MVNACLKTVLHVINGVDLRIGPHVHWKMSKYMSQSRDATLTQRAKTDIL